MRHASGPSRRRLLLFTSAADAGSRDAACATLAWAAADAGLLFECYYEARASGAHFGGGHPAASASADLLGGLPAGAHHLEQLLLLMSRFDCIVASLGPTSSANLIRRSGLPVITEAVDLGTFYAETFEALGVELSKEVLVVGDADRPQQIALAPYAYPEIVNRRLIALPERHALEAAALVEGRQIQSLWTSAPVPRAVAIVTPSEPVVSVQTAWMADRWAERARGYILGDPELIGRWTPTAARRGYLPIFGYPQADVIDRMRSHIQRQPVVIGRQQDDEDFLALSRMGTAFQLIDAGRPPLPVLADDDRAWPPEIRSKVDGAPSDSELRRWADEGRVLVTMLFWTGMARELEALYSLCDVLQLTGACGGLILTSASFDHMREPPLTLVQVDRTLGGLAPNVETLLASAGSGAVLESETPPKRFAATLDEACEHIRRILPAGSSMLPRGWWGVMDAALEPVATPRVSRFSEFPWIRGRYRPRPMQPPDAHTSQNPRRDIRSRLRDSPARRFMEPLRPFDDHRAGSPRAAILSSVRDAGFEYAFTKAAWGGEPRVVRGFEPLTVLNYTAGNWDGWTPFVTVSSVKDLKRAGRRLRRRRRPGWLVGAIDACLWAFTGTVWDRANELKAMCTWLASGGGDGELVNATPRTVARYAALLAQRGDVNAIDAR